MSDYSKAWGVNSEKLVSLLHASWELMKPLEEGEEEDEDSKEWEHLRSTWSKLEAMWKSGSSNGAVDRSEQSGRSDDGMESAAGPEASQEDAAMDTGGDDLDPPVGGPSEGEGVSGRGSGDGRDLASTTGAAAAGRSSGSTDEQRDRTGAKVAEKADSPSPDSPSRRSDGAVEGRGQTASSSSGEPKSPSRPREGRVEQSSGGAGKSPEEAVQTRGRKASDGAGVERCEASSDAEVVVIDEDWSGKAPSAGGMGGRSKAGGGGGVVDVGQPTKRGDAGADAEQEAVGSARKRSRAEDTRGSGGDASCVEAKSGLGRSKDVDEDVKAVESGVRSAVSPAGSSSRVSPSASKTKNASSDGVENPATGAYRRETGGSSAGGRSPTRPGVPANSSGVAAAEGDGGTGSGGASSAGAPTRVGRETRDASRDKRQASFAMPLIIDPPRGSKFESPPEYNPEDFTDPMEPMLRASSASTNRHRFLRMSASPH